MKLWKIVVLALVSSPAWAVSSPLMYCGEVGGQRSFHLDSAGQGVSICFKEEPGCVYSEDVKDQVFKFQRGNWESADFLSLEIRRVNGRFIGVEYRPATRGPARYKETVFSCAEIYQGSASSNGGPAR